MKIGIFGLPLSGKKTIFKILAGIDSARIPHRQEPVEGFTEIDDSRLYKLQEIYKPKRTVKSRIYLELLPDFEGEIVASGRIFALMEDCDALCGVIRLFSDDRVYHPGGSVDPARDIRNLNSEILLHDLAFAEKRIEKLQKEKKPKTGASGELELMLELKAVLEDEKPLRTAEFKPGDKSMISGYPFLTLKPMITVLNLGENETTEEHPGIDSLLNRDKLLPVGLCAKLESEVEELPPGNDRREMLEAMGISIPAAESLKKTFLKALNQMSFFTTSGNELRHWLAPAGSTAENAAGRIHTDMERGFIKAEVIKYEDLVEAGSEEKAAAVGKKMLKGRDYPLNDGDIMSIRFNV